MKTGTQVRTMHGTVETVLVAQAARIITYESAERNDWYHPSKVWPITKRSSTSDGQPEGRRR